MRYLALWLIAAVVIFNGLTDAGYFGPELSLIVVPIWSAALSSGVLLAASLIGLPIRFSAVSRVWHGTALGHVVAALAVALGCFFIWVAFTARQHATSTHAILGLCGLIAIEFAVVYCPERRKA
jgi:hypothetical protein